MATRATLALRYREEGGGPNDIYTRVIPFKAVRGFDDPDVVQLVPGAIYHFLDGTSATQFVGFRRAVTIEFGVLRFKDDHLFILNWLVANERSITYLSDAGLEEIIVAEDEPGIESRWVDNCKLGKAFTLLAIENVLRTGWATYTPASGVDIMYVKCKVKVEGTQANPETFTTNSGKLELMENGQSWPNVSLLSWVPTVVANGSVYQDAHINQVGDITNTGTSLTFKLAVSDAGSPAPDGFYYCDVILFLQARS